MKSEMRKSSIAAAMALSFLAVASGPAAANTLKGSEIKQTISGKRIYLAVPLGGEFPLHYKRNGVVNGDGKALGLGRYLRPKDSGRWWVTGNNLCQQWQSWYDGRQFCFTLQRLGPTKLRWNRDDGESGVARIGS